MLSAELKRFTPPRAMQTLERACERSDILVSKAEQAIANFSASEGLATQNLCFIVVGSVGRGEALEASDFDFVPVAASAEALDAYAPHDGKLRSELARALGVKVSKGADLTKPISLGELTEADCIGGAKDNSSALTKRILILTEGRQVGGALEIKSVRKAVLEAYANENRTSGRHVLSLCNDIARYYKTLCVEYKAKIDDEEKDWCTRNAKLRHSRKFWYFSNIVAIVKVSADHPLGQTDYVGELLQVFSHTPVERLAGALSPTHPIELGQLLESYFMFLEFMSAEDNRGRLALVEHEKRYDMTPSNPFPTMKFNSEVLHRAMLATIYGLPSSMRDRVIGWFLL